jgi:hypothetical protein
MLTALGEALGVDPRALYVEVDESETLHIVWECEHESRPA